MKICLMIQGLSAGGAERQFFYLVRGLSESHNVSVICLSNKGKYWDKLRATCDLTLYFLDRQNRYDFSFLSPLRNVLTSIKPDVLQTFMHASNSIGGLLRLFNDSAVHVTGIRSSDNWYDNMGSYLFLLGDLIASHVSATKIICNSRNGMAVHRRIGFPERKMTVIPNGINVNEIEKLAKESSPVDINADRFNVGIFATISPKKDHQTFLRAMKKLTREASGIQVFMAGNYKKKYWNRIQKQFRTLLKQDCITYLGELDNAYPVISEMDVVVSSSAFGEGMSNTLMEAMALNVPVVATDVGDARRLITPEEEGLIVPRGDAGALKDAVDRVRTHPELARRMAGKARNKIQMYSTEKMINNYVSIYRNLLNEG